ncbi:MAG: 50S ribosomal protein L31 [SAR324 cluster bacterium]|jgi:large subunit ribosomal protein L31|nr:50S ribosomal protein L31 [SAR324 cluster bacterium]MEC7417080.1 50S ribosomal protein L31 [SAR324 cluster bacterium]HBI29558.1 50S ribosomal protein L31 [Deltaproteobacteria bacterium]HIF70329.1 50S ribosomal protein L31 [Candidatus Lambdaproteobacteria bacterium]HIL15441.1 50S ribosomal protein L31 [Deltaproteobacteria bacterium]|tara:strand:+ start:1622 stop:1831 length:210 start_codon:yes stop_codon:yes gene_type:complete
MRAEIHPNYVTTTFVCSCGSTRELESTLGGEQHVDICSACHPFFTGSGQARIVDAAGRIEKFKRRYQSS